MPRRYFVIVVVLFLSFFTGAAGAAARQPTPDDMPGAGARNGSRLNLGLTLTGSPKGHVASSITVAQSGAQQIETSQAMRIVVGLSLLALIPAVLVCATAFLRIVIVLSMLRHAMGLPETPPNMVIVGLAVFLTLFTMGPVLGKVNDASLQPFLRGEVSMQKALDEGVDPLREFMLRQTKRQDLDLMAELARTDGGERNGSVSTLQLLPAFMLSELRSAFQIAFLVFLPFLLVDLLVASVLMALGMMMVPPTTISLPLKLLMFVLVDGWSLLLRALVGSFR